MGIPAPLGVTASGLPDLGDQANAVVTGTFAGVGPGKPFAFRGPMNVAIYAKLVTSLVTVAGSLASTVGSATGLAAGVAIQSTLVPHGTTVGGLASTTATLAFPPLTYWVTGLNINGTAVTLPPGSNVNQLLGAAVSVPSSAEQITLAANTVVAAILQTDVAPSLNNPGTPGIVQLSAAPTAVPPNTQAEPLEFALAANGVLAGTDAAATFTGAAITFSGTVQIERSFNGGKRWVVCNVGGSGQLAQYTGAAVGPISLTFGEPEKEVLYRVNCTSYASGLISYHMSQTGGAAESLAIGPLTSG